MAKYVISPKVINVHISQKIWTKKDKVVFDTEGKFKKDKADIESAFERGFLVLLEEKVKESKDLKAIKGIKKLNLKKKNLKFNNQKKGENKL